MCSTMLPPIVVFRIYLLDNHSEISFLRAIVSAQGQAG